MILDLCGGEAERGASEAGAEPAWRRNASLRFARLESFGGADVPADEAVASLRRLGFACVGRDAERVTVAVPSWRNDIAGRGALEPATGAEPRQIAPDGSRRRAPRSSPRCDLIEEVLRLRGLDPYRRSRCRGRRRCRRRR